MSPSGRFGKLLAREQWRGSPDSHFGLGEGRKGTAFPRQESMASQRAPVFRHGEDPEASFPDGV